MTERRGMAIQSADIDIANFIAKLAERPLRKWPEMFEARDAAIRDEERAAVLDHMPREAMADAAAYACWEKKTVREMIDAALSAARAALLPKA